MYTEMSACMFYRCFLRGFLSGILVPLKPSKSQVVKAVCILLCQKYPEAQKTFGAGNTSLSSILVVKLPCRGPEASSIVDIDTDVNV